MHVLRSVAVINTRFDSLLAVCAGIKHQFPAAIGAFGAACGAGLGTAMATQSASAVSAGIKYRAPCVSLYRTVIIVCLQAYAV